MKSDNPSDYIFFWQRNEKYGAFSNWYSSSFIIDGQKYCHVEQYMMAEKARLFGDMDAYQKILSTDDPSVCKKTGRAVKNYDGTVWNKVRYETVLNGCRAKFEQNPELKELLLSTGDKLLAEASPNDGIWGIGLKAAQARELNPDEWKGTNLLGKALMELREELRKR